LENFRKLPGGKQIEFEFNFSHMHKVLTTCIWMAIVFYALPSLAQNREAAFAMNTRLWRGVNMGNSFEAPSETEWGNPWKAEYFEIIANLGFKHVRLPVRWEPADRSLAVSPFTITPSFLARIQEVVDAALANKLHIIVNMHHHESLYANPAVEKERFLSQWNQIATHFKDYPDSLLFEVLNEPHGQITPAIWNTFFADALTEIRKTNPERVVLLGVAEYGGLGAIPQLQLPNDEHIILSPHYYNPFNFTHQGAEWVGPQANGWLGTTWNDTEPERETIEAEFSTALQFSEENHIPIHVGEFGAYSTADLESRKRWTTFLARWFEGKDLSWAYWEFSAGFGIYNPTTKVINTTLSNALLIDAMPDPTPLNLNTIYSSNLSSGTDGWALGVQGGANASLSVGNQKLNVTGSQGGTESWHIQLTRGNLGIYQGRLYKVSFKANALQNRNATFYVGKASAPWTAYSGYSGFNLTPTETQYTFSFTMGSPTDLAARLVFDLGQNTTGLNIWDIKVEESFLITAIEPSLKQVTAYPNPVEAIVTIENLNDYSKASVYAMNGKLMDEVDITFTSQRLNMAGYPSGLFIVKLIGRKGNHYLKLVKQ